jgi:hypothetical protein
VHGGVFAPDKGVQEIHELRAIKGSFPGDKNYCAISPYNVGEREFLRRITGKSQLATTGDTAGIKVEIMQPGRKKLT